MMSALEQAALAGIHCLRIPTPFAVGRVNCYLLEDEPLTLIDTGPNSGKALDELQSQLAEHGHAIEDIELLVITHQHIDHLGLAEIVVQRSGAKVVGPVPLPTDKNVWCVLKSPHVNKRGGEHFEIRTHKRLIDIINPPASTIDALMQLDLPAGVDIEIKLG